MEEAYRYHRPGMQLEYYTLGELQSSPPPAGEQPPLVRDLFPVRRDDPLNFAAGEPDIRGFAVNTPNGDTLGIVEGLLADAAHHTVPYAYIQIDSGKMVVTPTMQLTPFSDNRLVIIEGGKPALDNAPVATFEEPDADNANRYWITLRRNNAA